MNEPNPHAQALGRLARGHPKRISPAESERRRQSLALARQKRYKVTPDELEVLQVIDAAPLLTDEIRARLQAKVAEVFQTKPTTEKPI